jgi:hypothetical protein
MVTIEPAHRTYNPEFEEVPKDPPDMFLLTMKKAGTTTLTAADAVALAFQPPRRSLTAHLVSPIAAV